MSSRLRACLALLIALASGSALALAAIPAAGSQNGGTIRCAGTADFCGATVSIAGGARNRVVTIDHLSTSFRRVALRVIGGEFRGAFRITHARFLLGGSAYRFTLDAVRSNRRRARIVLLFAAGRSSRLAGYGLAHAASACGRAAAGTCALTICRQSCAWRLFRPVPWLLLPGSAHAPASAPARVDPAEAGRPAAEPARLLCRLHCATA